MRQILLQDPTTILLRSTKKVNCKMRQVYHYKMRHLLQNTMFFYKMHRYKVSSQFKMNFNQNIEPLVPNSNIEPLAS